MWEIAVTNIFSNSSTIASMKDTVASSASHSKTHHINHVLISLIKKSKNLGTRIVKGIISENLTSLSSLKHLWRSNPTKDHKKDKSQELNQITEVPEILERKVSKKGKDLQTKNIKVITREDLLSNRYELDPFHNLRPNSPTSIISPRHSHTFSCLSNSSSSTLSQSRRKSSSMQRSSSFQHQSKKASGLKGEHRSASTTQIMTEGELQRRRSIRSTYIDRDQIQRNKTVRFKIHEEVVEENLPNEDKIIKEEFLNAVMYDLQDSQDDDPAFFYVPASTLSRSITKDSDISDSHLIYV